MTASQPETITLRELLRRNFARLRAARGLSTRALEARLLSLGSKLTSPAIVRIEKGTRALSLGDWVAASVALNAPLSAFLVAADDVEQVQLAEGVYVSPSDLMAWFSGTRYPTRAEGVAPWLSQPGAWEEHRAEHPEQLERLAPLNHHPAAHAVGRLNNLVTAAILGSDPKDPSRPGVPVPMTREAGARLLRKVSDRTQRLVDQLAADVAEGETPGEYLTPSEVEADV